VEMDFVGRYDDQRILFCDEYLWLYHWTRKKGDTIEFQFQNFQRRKRIAIILLYFTVAFVVSVYHYFGKFTTWYAYVDTFITGIFFRGMYSHAKRKLDILIIEMQFHYFSKGFTFTSFQYIVFTIVAILAI
jgi:nicotinamide mononucleotide transporter